MINFKKINAIDILDKYSTVDNEKLKEEYKSKITGLKHNRKSYSIFCYSLDHIVHIDEMVSNNVRHLPIGKTLSILRLCIGHMLNDDKKEKYPAIINVYCGIAYEILKDIRKVNFISGVLNTIKTKL